MISGHDDDYGMMKVRTSSSPGYGCDSDSGWDSESCFGCDSAADERPVRESSGDGRCL